MLKSTNTPTSQPRCGIWADSGECTKNPDYMYATCRKACNQCSKSINRRHPGDFHHASWEERYSKARLGFEFAVCIGQTRFWCRY